MSLSLKDAAKVGGSDLASLLGRSPWGTPFTLYARIVSALEGRSMPHEDSAPKRRGRVLERAVLDLYAEETQTQIKYEGLRLTHPHLAYGRASLDALALKGNLLRVVDAKTAGLSEVRKWGEAGTDEVPEYILYQMTWYAGLHAYGESVPLAPDVAALVGGDLRVYSIGWDGELFGMLEVAVERFWKDHVEPRRPPPMTDPLVELPAIGALYPRHEGEAKQWDSLADGDKSDVAQWLRARARQRSAAADEKALEARVRMLLGTTPQLVGLPGELGVRRIDFKQNKSSAVTDWERIVRDVLPAYVGPIEYKNVLEQFTKPKEGARPLVVREAKEET